MGIKLNHAGSTIVRKGGSDKWDDDGLLIGEIISRAPNMSLEDYQQTFVALRDQYGEEALRAIRDGHVQFELISPRDQKQ